MKYSVILMILIKINIRLLNGYTITGRCGRPLIPPNAKLLQNSTDKHRFDENEIITVLCEPNQFPNNHFVQKQICSKGHWRGKRARCAKNLEANVIQIQVHECDSLQSLELLKIFVYQSEEGQYKLPPNAYHSSRHNESVIVKGAHCYHWKIQLDKSVKIANLLLDFFTNVNSTSKPHFTIEPNVGKYRTCQLQNTRHQVIDGNLISGWYYYCDLNSENDHEKELNDMTSEIHFTMKSPNKHEIRLEAVFIGGIYTIGSHSDTKSGQSNCGDIEIETPSVLSLQENTFNNIICNDSFYNYDFKTNHKFECNYNGQWTGEWPKCIPIVTCHGLSQLNQEIDSSVVIEEIGNVYYLNDIQWYAINESWIKYRCVNDEDIMVGMSSRVCDTNGKWTQEAPYCSSTGIAIVGTLIVVLIIIIIIVLIIIKFVVRRVKKETRNEIAKTHQKKLSEDLYADVNDGEFYDNPDYLKKSCSAYYETVSYDPITPSQYEMESQSYDQQMEHEYLDMTIKAENVLCDH